MYSIISFLNVFLEFLIQIVILSIFLLLPQLPADFTKLHLTDSLHPQVTHVSSSHSGCSITSDSGSSSLSDIYQVRKCFSCHFLHFHVFQGALSLSIDRTCKVTICVHIVCIQRHKVLMFMLHTDIQYSMSQFVLRSKTTIYLYLPVLLPVIRILNGIVTMEMFLLTLNINLSIGVLGL